MNIRLEIDRAGTEAWSCWREIEVPARSGFWLMLPDAECGPATALRLVPAAACRITGTLLAATPEQPALLPAAEPETAMTGRLQAGGKTEPLTFVAGENEPGTSLEPGAYELGLDGVLRPCAAGGVRIELKEPAAGPDFSVGEDALSVVARDAAGNPWRLPRGSKTAGPARGIDSPGGSRLVEACGTFYEVPGGKAGGWSRAVPSCTYAGRISDFCFWQGRLVLAGALNAGNGDGRMVRSADGRASLWIGQPDELRKLGKPCGTGMVWSESAARLDMPSDPFLMWGYDRKTLEITNHGLTAFVFTIEADPAGRNAWIKVADLSVLPGARRVYEFPAGFSAHWIRLVPRNDGRVSATFIYR